VWERLARAPGAGTDSIETDCRILYLPRKPPVKDILRRELHFLALKLLLFVEQGISVDIDTYSEANLDIS
jgi:hypothetical protein